VQQNDIIILLVVVAKAGLIFYALSLSLFFYSIRVLIECRARVSEESDDIYLSALFLLNEKRIISR
jgi:hypothetical protein